MLNELTVIFTAMAPISELRGAIPLGLHIFKFGLLKTLTLSIIGNFLPVPFILYLLPRIEIVLRKGRFFDKIFHWLYRRTRHKFEGNYLKWGELALMIIVAVPLPMTGAWTGALAAHLFGIPKNKAALFIFLGILGAAAIVTVLDLWIVSGFKKFL